VVVGPERPELSRAITVREDPPGGGPVPALRAGLVRVGAPFAAILAADLPFLRASHVDELRRRASGAPGAVLTDDDGRPQWLAGVWRVADLLGALRDYSGTSLRGLMEPLGPAYVQMGGAAWYDCDTQADVDAASRMIGGSSAR
jgi:molybdopterin-guanine dinucleotide biosynthesis protein A